MDETSRNKKVRKRENVCAYARVYVYVCVCVCVCV